MNDVLSTVAGSSSPSNSKMVELDRRHASPTVIEAGHYYEAKGPSAWSQAGWEILSALATPEDGRLLFIDNVHSLEQMSGHERHLERVNFDPRPAPTHIIYESDVRVDAEDALIKLKLLPRRRRARKSGRAQVTRCSGFPLIGSNGKPTCLFLDIGLTWRKFNLGFRYVVNVLPHFYEEEQRQLRRIMRKALPELQLDVILFDLDGTSRHLD